MLPPVFDLPLHVFGHVREVDCLIKCIMCVRSSEGCPLQRRQYKMPASAMHIKKITVWPVYILQYTRLAALALQDQRNIWTRWMFCLMRHPVSKITDKCCLSAGEELIISVAVSHSSTLDGIRLHNTAVRAAPARRLCVRGKGGTIRNYGFALYRQN